MLLTIAVIYGLFSYFTPIMNEDITLINVYKSHNGGQSTFSLSALAGLLDELRRYDVGRLGNIVAALADCLMPKWLFAAMSGICVACLFQIITVMARIPRSRRSAVTVLLWAVSLVWLPWRNWIMINAFMANYVYSSVAVLLFIWLFAKSLGKKKLSAPFIIISVIVALAAGCFHEGFAAPVCCALAVLAIVRRFRLSPFSWVLIALFVTSALYNVSSPGLLNRATDEVSTGRGLVEAVKFIAVCLPGFVVLLALLGLAYWRKRAVVIELFRRPVFMIVTLSAVFGAIMCLMVHSDSRSAWPAELFSLIAAASFLPYVKLGKMRAIVSPAASIIYVALVIFFINVLISQYALFRQHNRIMELLEHSPTGTVFYDIIPPDENETATLRLITSREWVFPAISNKLGDPDFNKTDKSFAVVPAALSGYAEDNATTLPGSAGLRNYNGILVGEDMTFADPKNVSSYRAVRFTTASGEAVTDVRAFCLRFVAPDGTYRTYVRPSIGIDSDRIVKADFID